MLNGYGGTMKLYTHSLIYGVKESGFQVVSDFMIPFVMIHNDQAQPVCLDAISFCVYGGNQCITRTELNREALPLRFQAAKEEWRLYRPAAWERILGLSQIPPIDSLAESFVIQPGQCAAVHQEFFRIHARAAADQVKICLRWDGGSAMQGVTVALNPQKNQYYFPIHRQCFVTGAYIDPDAHRWCRNSEFAIDIGLPGSNGQLDPDAILGEPVYAAADGVVLRCFGGVQEGETEPELLEEHYGNDVRIDGNHMILLHPNGECSLYAHLHHLSKDWKEAEAVSCGELIGYVGNTGNSSCPHLHFHVFQKSGAFGGSIPVFFRNLFDIYGDPINVPVRDDSLVFPR